MRAVDGDVPTAAPSSSELRSTTIVHGEQGAVVGREVRERPAEVEALDAGRRVAAGVAGDLDVDLDDRTAAPADDLAGLVGGHREQPRSDPIRVPQRVELAPGDEPGRLDRVLGQLPVATGHEGDPGHVGVVGRDEPGEGRLVARPRELDRGGDRLTAHHLTVHAL